MFYNYLLVHYSAATHIYVRFIRYLKNVIKDVKCAMFLKHRYISLLNYSSRCCWTHTYWSVCLERKTCCDCSFRLGDRTSDQVINFSRWCAIKHPFAPPAISHRGDYPNSLRYIFFSNNDEISPAPRFVVFKITSVSSSYKRKVRGYYGLYMMFYMKTKDTCIVSSVLYTLLIYYQINVVMLIYLGLGNELFSLSVLDNNV